MTDFNVGDRVKVVKDLEGDDEYVGHEGAVVVPAKYYKGQLAIFPLVRLDSRGPLAALHFAPDEIELVVAVSHA